MTGKERSDRDLQMLMMISGVEDPSQLTMTIEDNYLIREAMENRREQGLWVPDEWIPDNRSTEEKEAYRRIKELERLEAERCNLPEQEYDGKPDPEDRYYEPKGKTVEIL